MRFVKRPEEIEAVKCAEVLKGYVPDWLRTPIATQKVAIRAEYKEVKILREDGNITVGENDWIVLDSAGILSYCPSTSFERLWVQVK